VPVLTFVATIYILVIMILSATSKRFADRARAKMER
jgi:hypothetical protein